MRRPVMRSRLKVQADLKVKPWRRDPQIRMLPQRPRYSSRGRNFRATRSTNAPSPRRITAMSAVESDWPVAGSCPGSVVAFAALVGDTAAVVGSTGPVVGSTGPVVGGATVVGG